MLVSLVSFNCEVYFPLKVCLFPGFCLFLSIWRYLCQWRLFLRQSSLTELLKNSHSNLELYGISISIQMVTSEMVTFGSM